ncbi:hypothetical protein QWZ13_15100 [Reinekea marina]|nr:hypothetical protein [Reinekea marina]MDN3650245.1 hypothetical protein [Reinekea marina]
MTPNRVIKDIEQKQCLLQALPFFLTRHKLENCSLTTQKNTKHKKT